MGLAALRKVEPNVSKSAFGSFLLKMRGMNYGEGESGKQFISMVYSGSEKAKQIIPANIQKHGQIIDEYAKKKFNSECAVNIYYFTRENVEVSKEESQR
jgi:hypothetical protein